MSKNQILLLIVLGVIIVGGGVYFYQQGLAPVAIENVNKVNNTNQPANKISLETPANGNIEVKVDEVAVGDINQTVKTFIVGGGNYLFSLKEMKVKKGDKVKIVFTNNEGFHDLIIDEFKVNTGQIKAGESRTVEFVADKTGTFEYYCSVGQHRANGMVGKLIVE